MIALRQLRYIIKKELPKLRPHFRSYMKTLSRFVKICQELSNKMDVPIKFTTVAAWNEQLYETVRLKFTAEYE